MNKFVKLMVEGKSVTVNVSQVERIEATALTGTVGRAARAASGKKTETAIIYLASGVQLNVEMTVAEIEKLFTS